MLMTVSFHCKVVLGNLKVTGNLSSKSTILNCEEKCWCGGIVCSEKSFLPLNPSLMSGIFICHNHQRMGESYVALKGLRHLHVCTIINCMRRWPRNLVSAFQNIVCHSFSPNFKQNVKQYKMYHELLHRYLCQSLWPGHRRLDYDLFLQSAIPFS